MINKNHVLKCEDRDVQLCKARLTFRLAFQRQYDRQRRNNITYYPILCVLATFVELSLLLYTSSPKDNFLLLPHLLVESLLLQ